MKARELAGANPQDSPRQAASPRPVPVQPTPIERGSPGASFSWSCTQRFRASHATDSMSTQWAVTGFSKERNPCCLGDFGIGSSVLSSQPGC